MRQHSKTAWDIANKYGHVLGSETRDLAANIDVAIRAERTACADIALAIDSSRGNEKEIAKAIHHRTVLSNV